MSASVKGPRLGCSRRACFLSVVLRQNLRMICQLEEVGGGCAITYVLRQRVEGHLYGRRPVWIYRAASVRAERGARGRRGTYTAVASERARVAKGFATAIDLALVWTLSRAARCQLEEPGERECVCEYVLNTSVDGEGAALDKGANAAGPVALERAARALGPSASVQSQWSGSGIGG